MVLSTTGTTADLDAVIARVRAAASALQAALDEACGLGIAVSVRVEPGYEPGRVAPSAFFVEVDVPERA